MALTELMGTAKKVGTRNARDAWDHLYPTSTRLIEEFREGTIALAEEKGFEEVTRCQYQKDQQFLLWMPHTTPEKYQLIEFPYKIENLDRDLTNYLVLNKKPSYDDNVFMAFLGWIGTPGCAACSGLSTYMIATSETMSIEPLVYGAVGFMYLLTVGGGFLAHASIKGIQKTRRIKKQLKELKSQMKVYQGAEAILQKLGKM